MPRARLLSTNFTAGEFDPRLIGRSDIKFYFNAGEIVRNVIIVPQGGAEIRPGSRYTWTVPDIPEVDGGGISNIRLAEFQFNTEQTYLIAFHHKTITIFREGSVVASVVSPYSSADLVAAETEGGDLVSSGIYWTQSKDTMIIFHEGYPIKKLVRQGSHSSWAISNFELSNVPRFDFGEVYTDPDEIGIDEVHEIEFPNPGSQGNWVEGDTFTLIVEDEESENIRFLSNADALAASLQSELRAMKNTSGDGITVTHDGDGSSSTVDVTFTVTFTGADGQRPWGTIFNRVVSSQQVPSIDTFITTRGRLPGELVWSDARGYPRCGAFFQGRLWVAGTPSLPHWVWSSRVAAEGDFNTELFSDDYGIAVQADTTDVPAFTAIFPGRHLQVFSRSGEFYIPASEGSAVTPANVSLRRTTSRGCKPGLRVFDVDGGTHFVQRKGNALRELIFADVEQAYQATNLSLLSSHLMRDPVDFAVRKSTSTTDADYEFFPNSDGTLAVFCTLRTQEVNAMTLWKTEGDYVAVGVALDEVFFAVKRNIDGVDRLFIEQMDRELTVDCALSGDDDVSISLQHLPNTDIEHILDGSIQQKITSDASGNLTFARPSITNWSAGIRFKAPHDDHPELIWIVKTLPVEIQLPEGATLGRKRRIVNISVRLRETSALTLNQSVIPFQSFGSGLLDQTIEPFTGVKHIRGLLGWDYEGCITIGSPTSLRGEILGLSYGVSV